MKNDLEHRLLIAAGQVDGGHAAVARAMGVDAAQLSRIFSRTQGIPIDRLERMLTACEMRVVPIDAVMLDRADYEGLKRLAHRATGDDQTLTLPGPLVAVK